MKRKFAEINQLGFVVKDAARTASAFQQLFGVEPPVTIDATVTRDIAGGSIPSYEIRIAFLTLGKLQLEFIQVLKGRPAIYCDFLDRCGEGFHHVGVDVPDLDAALQQMKAARLRILWSGDIYGTRWAYLDTQAQLGTILELIEIRPPQPLGK
jgi:methylmalonyl-CoA/ethylmalonyl-CoA epimerase